MKNKSLFDSKIFKQGIRDGVPIGLGYFAVAFSLGIAARSSGLVPFMGFFASVLNHASAGEKALYDAIASSISYVEIAVITFVVNARYLLMSCALSQKLSSNVGIFHRIIVGFGISDEIFGIAIGQKEALNPFYNYGAMLIAIPLWSSGTALGIFAGNILPVEIVNALSVALYGMFIAIIIPPAKKNPVIAVCVIVSFALSYAFSVIPYLKELSDGNRTIILTVLISVVAAIVKPIPESENSDHTSDSENQNIQEEK